MDNPLWSMGEEENTKTIRENETLMTREKYFSGWTGGIHSIYLYAQHKKDDDLAKIFVMYLFHR
jgi:hypothetical protein